MVEREIFERSRVRRAIRTAATTSVQLNAASGSDDVDEALERVDVVRNRITTLLSTSVLVCRSAETAH